MRLKAFSPVSRHAAFTVAILVASVAAALSATASENPVNLLKGAYLGCERAAAAGKQGDDDVQCSILYEDLKRRTFGGDFRSLRTWYESERMNVSKSRPSPWDECLAWKLHVFAPIDDHRMAGDIDDDALFEIMRDYYAAQHECSAGNFAQGLQLYDAIPIGRVIGLMR